MHGMSRRVLILAKRDFIATVFTKPFIFVLLLFPLLFGGGFLVNALMQARANQQIRRVAIMDRTGVAAAAVIQAADEKNQRDLYDKLTGRQAMARYEFEVAPAAAGSEEEQRFLLSQRVLRRELYAFVEIGRSALVPPPARPDEPAPEAILFYSNVGGFDPFQPWFEGAVNDGLRSLRLRQTGVDAGRAAQVLGSVRLASMALVARDPRTGATLPPHKKGTIENFAVPYILVMILIMIVLFGSAQMVAAVAEDKLQRVYEMLLCSATPFELMMGKVLACVARSLVSSTFYILGGLLALQGMALFGLVPFAVLPWFFIYLVAEVIMLAALGTALGSACASPQEAQPLAVLVMLPVMIPLFLLVPVLQEPDSISSTALSLFPLFTPVLMLLRQTLPGGVPPWEPWAGLMGVLLFALAGTWAAARIFRIGVLFHGTTPKLAEILRWSLRG